MQQRKRAKKNEVKKEVKVNATVTRDTANKLQLIAQGTDRSVSYLIEVAIDSFLNDLCKELNSLEPGSGDRYAPTTNGIEQAEEMKTEFVVSQQLAMNVQ